MKWGGKYIVYYYFLRKKTEIYIFISDYTKIDFLKLPMAKEKNKQSEEIKIKGRFLWIYVVLIGSTILCKYLYNYKILKNYKNFITFIQNYKTTKS